MTYLRSLPGDAVGHILPGFDDLGAHQDAPDGVRLLRQHGPRLVTLSNRSPTSPTGC